ncbi:MAG: response regulator [Desulfobacterales bacterium]|nr:response regulator [Desulfobacterales bacterium]
MWISIYRSSIMINKVKNWLKRIEKFAAGLKQHFWQKSDTHQNVLLIWRKRIFNAIFLCTAITGAFAYVPNLLYAIQRDKWLLGIVWTIAYLLVLTIAVVQTIPFKLRVWAGLSIFYGVGFISLVALGPVGSGRMFLFAFALMASLLLGLRAGIIALTFNMGTFVFLTWMMSTGKLLWPYVTNYTSDIWVASGYSFFFFNTLITVSVGVLVAALETNLIKEQSLTKDLKLSNEKLEQENIERKLAEEFLRRSRERLKALTNNLQVGIYRNTGGPAGKFLEANPAMLEIFGFESRDAFFDIKVSDLYRNPADRQKFSENLIREGFVRNKELLLKKKDGTPIICSVSAKAVSNGKGEVKHYDGVIEDITEHKQMEMQIQQSQKMRAIGLLAGGVAHDLNNILSGIVSYPELILLDLPEDSPLKEPIRTIQESGKKAAAIVQDLLTLARRGVSNFEVINLNDVIFEYLKSPEFEKLKSFHPLMDIKTDLKSDLLNIMGSAVHLSKTVMNLFSNAAEAMSKGGEILIKTENKYIERSETACDDIEEGDYVVMTISDTGIGIAPEELDRIFEPFYTKKVMGRSGTGLGMAVVWGTVKDHNGYIKVDSKLDHGTTFQIYFPITRAEATNDLDLNDAAYYEGKGEKILVVDDVEEQRQIASKILSRLGYSVKVAGSGEEALEILGQETADLIVLDMIMPPGIDGLETYEQIVSSHPGQKAIIASGFSETDRVKKAQQLGAGRYLKKPYTMDKIGMAVKRELNRENKAACFN